jgi:hypothetical protein
MHGLFHSAINVPTDHIYSVCPHTPFAKSTCDMPIFNCMSACSNIKNPKYNYDNSAGVSGSLFNEVVSMSSLHFADFPAESTHTSLRQAAGSESLRADRCFIQQPTDLSADLPAVHAQLINPPKSSMEICSSI